MRHPFVLPIAFMLVACGGDDDYQTEAAEVAAPAGSAEHAEPAEAASLDAMFGQLPAQCARSEAGKRLLDSSMTRKEDGLTPTASAAVEAPAELAGVFGVPSVSEVKAEFTTIKIPVSSATLFGLPVAALTTYWGHENGVGGMTVHFAVPRQALVDAVGPRLAEGEWDHPAVSPELSAEGHAVFLCDWSM